MKTHWKQWNDAVKFKCIAGNKFKWKKNITLSILPLYYQFLTALTSNIVRISFLQKIVKNAKPTSTHVILWVLRSSVTATFIQLRLNSCFSEGELLIQYFAYIFVWLTASIDHLLNRGHKFKVNKIFGRYQGSPRLFKIS